VEFLRFCRNFDLNNYLTLNLRVRVFRESCTQVSDVPHLLGLDFVEWTEALARFAMLLFPLDSKQRHLQQAVSSVFVGATNSGLSTKRPLASPGVTPTPPGRSRAPSGASSPTHTRSVPRRAPSPRSLAAVMNSSSTLPRVTTKHSDKSAMSGETHAASRIWYGSLPGPEDEVLQRLHDQLPKPTSSFLQQFQPNLYEDCGKGWADPEWLQKTRTLKACKEIKTRDKVMLVTAPPEPPQDPHQATLLLRKAARSAKETSVMLLPGYEPSTSLHGEYALEQLQKATSPLSTMLRSAENVSYRTMRSPNSTLRQTLEASGGQFPWFSLRSESQLQSHSGTTPIAASPVTPQRPTTSPAASPRTTQPPRPAFNVNQRLPHVRHRAVEPWHYQ